MVISTLLFLYCVLLEPLAPIIQPPVGSIVSEDNRKVTASVGTRVNAFKEATLLLTCLVQGVPAPEISWSKGDQKVVTGARFLLVSNGTLIIRNSSVDDSGNYTCTANSSVGQDSSTSPVFISGKLST